MVVIADARGLHHVLQVADDSRGAQVIPTRGDQRLMHVQPHGTGGSHSREVDIARLPVQGPVRCAGQAVPDQVLVVRPGRQPVDLFRYCAH